MASSLPSQILQQHFTIVRKLGEGTFASVFQATWLKSDEKVAIKQIYVQKCLIDEALGQVFKLKSLRNDHIVGYRYQFYDSEQFSLNLVMQMCNDSLRGQLQKKKSYSLRQLQSFIVQITSAFLELENKQLMHLDMKPENILIANKEGTYYKICDFGCSQMCKLSKMSGYQQTVFGTFNYLAPEIHINTKFKKNISSADIWSLGITLYEMIYGKLPFPLDQNMMVRRPEVQSYIKKGYQIDYKQTKNYHSIINIVKLMLKPVPLERPTWPQLKQYLIKSLEISQYQFRDIEITVLTFNPTAELFLKISKVIKEILSIKSGLYETIQQFYQNFVDYVYRLVLKFMERQKYRFHTLPEAPKDKLTKSFNDLEKLEREICKKKQIEMPSYSDLEYREIAFDSQAKRLLSQLQQFSKNNKLSDGLKVLLIFCEEMTVALTNRLCLFSDPNVFKKCFKLKF